MKINEYKLIQRCIEEGARYGMLRAFKHDDTPTSECIVDEIVIAVMQELCEWIKLEHND
jgi:hypothetical protein